MIEVKNLSKTYSMGKKLLKAVDDVSFSIAHGETLGLVGESGSGKSTIGRMILGLVAPTSGQVFLDGKEITGKMVPRRMQMIFQDAYSSLNPRMTVEQILQEPLIIHNLPERTDELLDFVALPRTAKKRYPHEFSGGQRQRIGIARALALNPDFIVCDEPISSLDVSIGAQILDLLINLQKALGLTYLFITHDLAIVRSFSTKLAVMHLGKIVEIGETEEIITSPQHPYSQLLLSSALTLG